MQVPFEDAVALGMRTAAVIVERWSHPLQQREGRVSRGLPEGWHNHEGYRQIFCAALSGITANPTDYSASIERGRAALAQKEGG